jgi:hypothetical protein
MIRHWCLLCPCSMPLHRSWWTGSIVHKVSLEHTASGFGIWTYQLLETAGQMHACTSSTVQQSPMFKAYSFVQCSCYL